MATIQLKVNIDDKDLQVSIDNEVSRALAGKVQQSIDERIDAIISTKLSRIDEMVLREVEEATKDKLNRYGVIEKLAREVIAEKVIAKMPVLAD